MSRPKDLGLEHTWRTRSRVEGESRSAAKRCGSMKADPAARGPEATPQGASVSSDRSAQNDSKASGELVGRDEC
jgi:hypothetical protein